MDYLARDTSSLDAALWAHIDETVVTAAKKLLTGRRFLSIYGPLGAASGSVAIDDADALTEVVADGFVTTAGRRYAEIPLLYEDFSLLSRDLMAAEQTGRAPDLTAAAAAAQQCALREDKLIFYGNHTLGIEGLFTAPGVGKRKRGNWAEGETAFADVAGAIAQLAEQAIYGSYTLVLSPDMHLQLQRIQPGTGLLEIDRLAKLVDGRIFKTPALAKGSVVLLSAEPRNVDLVVGQDLSTAYLELKDLNHNFRVLESVLPRIKRKSAIVVFEG